ncbi:tRNA pseudouridine38-40 synthase [Cyclobacterium lianum]|uniref:tRNA pseudouridine synthase A n=1 Tax=Cyclobacterium lianum TaxID=388280 RepID=A0A1M7NHE5_9BACT|nr:tRNA pseudouridine(38-40) synthase TruA [Cyclobacterium lianum]SHN03197.1 tRNA pseudouridine38-40 synthase [Cyclobacterium lianum]
MTNARRYFIELAYNGSNYHGWQVQANASSVQESIQVALSTLFRTGISIMGSGRTDTGVHARQQFAHFDIGEEVHKGEFLKRLNGLLAGDIAVFDVLAVRSNAHARFDALWRRYEYHICFRKDPFQAGRAWHCYYDLDLAAMESAAALLLGKQDFECFSKTKTGVKGFDCEIKSAFWEQTSHGLIFHIKANRFLRGMVRAIVGTLVQVGRRQVDMAQFAAIIKSKDRSKAGIAVPAQGLYLSEVHYPRQIFI